MGLTGLTLVLVLQVLQRNLIKTRQISIKREGLVTGLAEILLRTIVRISIFAEIRIPVINKRFSVVLYTEFAYKRKKLIFGLFFHKGGC